MRNYHDYLKDLKEHQRNCGGANYCLSNNIDAGYRNLYPKLSKQQIFELSANYPNGKLTDLKNKIKAKFMVNDLAFGAGSEDLLIRINRIVTTKDQRIGIVTPIFYRILDTLDSGKIQRLSLENLIRGKVDCDVVWLNNPNPFTGEIISKETLLKIIKRTPLTMFIIDEASMFLVDNWEKFSLLKDTKGTSNFIVLASFSKLYGVSGLRAGFASGNKKLLEAIETTGLTFPLTGISIHILSEIINKDSFFSNIKKKIATNKANIEAVLKAIPGIEVKESGTNCVYCRFTNGRSLYEALLKVGIIGLDLDTQQGMAKCGYVRLTVHSSARLHEYLTLNLRQLNTNSNYAYATK